jgi:hypothetical protein
LEFVVVLLHHSPVVGLDASWLKAGGTD